MRSCPAAIRGVRVERSAAGGFDYVILFESSGMYRGEDIVGLASHLAAGRLDAVWGSRRLSVRDIEESYRLRYDRNALLGAISYAGSHVLSLAYLLSTAATSPTRCRPCAPFAPPTPSTPAIDLSHKRANQHLLSGLLRRKAELLEIPVQFFPISPEQVKRTSPLDGLQALVAISGAASRRRGRRRRPRNVAFGRKGSRPARCPRAVMSTRLLVIPAAGLGSRLGAGCRSCSSRSRAYRCSIDLLDLYRSAVDRVVVVVGPSFDSDVKRHVAARPDYDRVDCVVQASPTGMLDAILLAMPIVERHGRRACG